MREAKADEAQNKAPNEKNAGIDVKSEDQLKPIQTTRVTKAALQNSFMALIQFFEATRLETLRRTQPNEARLLEKICAMILRNVSDAETYSSCLRVSRRFRFMCQQRPLIKDNVVLLEPESSNSASLSWDPINLARTPDFLAVEVSSGRQMEVMICDRGYSDRTTCLVVAGSEWNRKTYVPDCKVTFHGLSLPAPRRTRKVGKRKRAASR